MSRDREIDILAGELRTSIGLLLRRLRQAPAAGELTLPETAALARLDRGGPTASADLARAEHISPQSMGATIAALERRGLVGRTADPADGRRAVMSLSDAGRQALRDRRSSRTEALAGGLRSGFTDHELALLRAAAPLLERLAQSI